jgi:phosphoribosylpyrophosphate synthetase
MKLSGSEDIRVALISNSRALNEYTMSDNAAIVGDVAGRQCIIVRSFVSETSVAPAVS